MDFTIQAGEVSDPQGISLPAELRKEMGLLVGQSLEIKTEGIQLILQITTPVSPEQQCALVNDFIYAQIKGQDLEYNILEVTLGCDPEFFILHGQRRVSATMCLPFIGQIGCDGELGELRPPYAKHEYDVVKNLTHLIGQIPTKVEQSQWASKLSKNKSGFSYEAHSFFMNLSAGFHIHLGLPPELLSTRKNFDRVAINHLIQCLDWYVSVPCVLVEENHKRRLGESQYGRPGDWRASNVTLEYRTPGAFFLRTPHLATSLLGTSLAVVEVLVNRIKEKSENFVNLHKLSKADLNEMLPVPYKDRILEALTHKNVEVAKKELPYLRDQLQALTTYRKHRMPIDGLFRAGEYRSRVSPNLLTNWKEKL